MAQVAVQRLRTHERLLADVEVQIPRANKEAARQQAEMRKQRRQMGHHGWESGGMIASLAAQKAGGETGTILGEVINYFKLVGSDTGASIKQLKQALDQAPQPRPFSNN